MVVSGLPNRNGDNHAVEISKLSLKLLQSIKQFTVRHRPDQQLQLRIGLHSGKYQILYLLGSGPVAHWRVPDLMY
jgi:class 3 adenylate cyclase